MLLRENNVDRKELKETLLTVNMPFCPFLPFNIFALLMLHEPIDCCLDVSNTRSVDFFSNMNVIFKFSHAACVPALTAS
jgi:hypothetical protein